MNTAGTYRTTKRTNGRLITAARSALCVLLLGLGARQAEAQNFVNSGQLHNAGTFRVKNGVAGLPDTVGGTFEYFGANQQVQGTNYTTLHLTGTPGSTKATIGGDFSILMNVTITPAITLQVKPGAVMTLDKAMARLTENGILLGHVRKNQDLLNPADSSDFGGIGLSIRATGNAPGTTTVVRASGTSVTANGHTSIGRVVDITPAAAVRSDIYFAYASTEKTGQDSSALDLWRSLDGGTSWRREHTQRMPSAGMLRSAGNFLGGMWTASDTLHPLGRMNYESDPDSMSAVGPDSVKARVLKPAQPFIAKVTDVFGNALAGVTVQFLVTMKPAGATGESLSQISAVTDTLGQVTTALHTGTLRGRYEVTAQVASRPSTKHIFVVEALPGPVALPIVAGNNQTDSIKVLLPGALMVVARDSDGVAVDGVPVQFAIVSIPAGATGQSLSRLQDTTDALGQSHATFRFGTKTGRYIVRVTSPEIPRDSATFILTATHGFAALAWADTVTRRDSIGATTAPMTYTITDGDTNAVPGRATSFAITARPLGSIGDTLLSIAAITDTLGQARATLRLGSKVGRYTVAAVDPALTGSGRSFQADAGPGAPASIIPTVTAATDTIGTLLPAFRVTVTDRGANPIPGLSIGFSETSRPAGSSGDSLLIVAATTDTAGGASSRFRLGDKTGNYTVRSAVTLFPALHADIGFQASPGVPARLFADGGLNQIKPILQALDSLFVARLTDRASNPIQGDTIQFSLAGLPAGAFGQSLSAAQAVTDSLGHAVTRLTVGSKIGIYRTHAQFKGNATVQADFVARAVNGQPTAIVFVSGDNQKKAILSLLDSAFVVRLTDVGSNPVPGAPVSFHIQRRPAGASSDSLTIANAVTDSAGQATSILALGTKVGDYAVSATTGSLPNDTVYFHAKALVGAPAVVARMSGNAQHAQVGDKLNPFVVRVTDRGDNPVRSTPVQFRTTVRPAGAVGDTLVPPSAMTDSLGQASSVLTLGNQPGTYVVHATAGGATDTSFVATAIYVVADANHDGYQNIGDLTAVIDHILGKRLLKGMDLVRGDLDHNGIIDIRDAILLRDSLLAGVWDPMYNWTAYLPANRPVGPVAAQQVAQARESAGPNPIEGQIQRTHIGARFHLKNDIPVKGIQAILYMKRPTPVDTVDLIFPAASMMQVGVESVGKQINVVAYNYANAPIPANTDTVIFRLPIKLGSVADIDSIRFIVSADTNVATLIPSAVTDRSSDIPVSWALYQNYPNPFNGLTHIQFDIPEVAGKLPRIAVQIFDLLGRKVITIEKGFYDAHTATVTWDGRNDRGEHVSSGVYFYRLLGPEYTSTKKMILIK